MQNENAVSSTNTNLHIVNSISLLPTCQSRPVTIKSIAKDKCHQRMTKVHLDSGQARNKCGQRNAKVFFLLVRNVFCLILLFACLFSFMSKADTVHWMTGHCLKGWGGQQRLSSNLVVVLSWIQNTVFSFTLLFLDWQHMPQTKNFLKNSSHVRRLYVFSFFDRTTKEDDKHCLPQHDEKLTPLFVALGCLSACQLCHRWNILQKQKQTESLLVRFDGETATQPDICFLLLFNLREDVNLAVTDPSAKFQLNWTFYSGSSWVSHSRQSIQDTQISTSCKNIFPSTWDTYQLMWRPGSKRRMCRLISNLLPF